MPSNRIRTKRANVKSNSSVDVRLAFVAGRSWTNDKWIWKKKKKTNHVQKRRTSQNKIHKSYFPHFEAMRLCLFMRTTKWAQVEPTTQHIVWCGGRHLAKRLNKQLLAWLSMWELSIFITSPFSNGIALANFVEQITSESLWNWYGSFWPGKLYRDWQSASLAPKYCHG